MPNLHYFQHEPFEHPGTIRAWAESRGFSLAATHLYKGEAIAPNPKEVDVLVVMGGSMNADEEAKYPWLAVEKTFIRAVLDEGKYVLGICLGAQLTARVLGAPVTQNAHKEIGWFPVQFADHPLVKNMGALPVFHWHGDTFGIPQGAARLAASEACANQAYLWQNRALGLQFHMETMEEQVQEFALHGDAEIAEGGPYVQTPAAMAAGLHHAPAMRRALHALLDRWLENAPFFAK